MLKKFTIMFVFVLFSTVLSSEHGIYVHTISNINRNIDSVGQVLLEKVKAEGFTVYNYYNIATPDIVRKEKTEQCNLKAKVIVFSSPDYVKMLTSYGNKYLVAAFLRIGIYETPSGVQVEIADPVTINMIVFNDLWDNDQEKEYNEVIKKTKAFKKHIVKLIHESNLGKNIEESMEPIRDDEDLREASKDMFMMVGHLTFFTDEDQFPEIYSTQKETNIKNFIKKIKTNINLFVPNKDDIDYRYTASPKVLKWRIVGEIHSPDSKAVLLGLTRPRTEGLSFDIAGSSRENDTNSCPGIDHAAAYPVEVLVIQGKDGISVYTPREMFRMDMYFWDAGMSAFMNHMSMPGILDESIGRALLGKEYKD